MAETKLKQQSLKQPTWVTPTLLNSWVNYSTDWNSAQYCKDNLGFVHLKGLVCNGSGIIFQLPVGYRPLKTNTYPTIANDALGRVVVYANGDVTRSFGSNAWFSLDGITFLAEN